MKVALYYTTLARTDERTASFVEGSSYVRKLDGTPHVLFGDRSGDRFDRALAAVVATGGNEKAAPRIGRTALHHINRSNVKQSCPSAAGIPLIRIVHP